MYINSKKWNNLLFEGRNRAYGAFQLRSTSSRRHFFSLLIVFSVLVAGFFVYQLLNAILSEKMPPLVNVMPPLVPAEAQELSDIQDFAGYEPPLYPTVSNEFLRSVAAENTEMFETEEAENINPELDELIKKTMEEQLQETAKDIKEATEAADSTVIYLVVDVLPSFPGGKAALLKFITTNMNYPTDAQRRRIQGQVVCSFVVGIDGCITDIRVDKKIDPILDREAVRIIKLMPCWTPAERLGNKVKVKYAIPFNFGM